MKKGESIFTEGYKSKVYVILGLLLLLWVIEAVNIFTGNSLIGYGILPRHFMGLFGIPLSPFLHGSLEHIAANTLPFICLGFLTILRGIPFFFKMSLFIIITSGLAVWFTGTPGFHIGASSLIFGYLGYLVGQACITKSQKDVMIAVIVGMLFGSMLFGVFPGIPGISWEGHLSGLIFGIIGAWLFRNQK